MATVDRTPSYQPILSEDQKQRSLKTGQWQPAEDERLREAVGRHGTRWASAALDVRTRNGDQCAKRWDQNLNPRLNHGAWTPQEEQNLLCLVDHYGHNWKFIANGFFETRAPLALKNRYSSLMRRSKRQTKCCPQQSPMNVSSTPPRSNIYWHPSDVDPAQSPDSRINTAGLLTGEQLPLPQPPGYGPDESGSDTAVDTLAANGPFSTAGGSWGDQNPVWLNNSFHRTTNQLESTLTNLAPPGTEIPTSNLSKYPQSCENIHLPEDYTHWSAAPMSSPPSRVWSGVTAEYSVTCRRERFRTVVNHLVDAVSEDAEGHQIDDLVTLKLQLIA